MALRKAVAIAKAAEVALYFDPQPVYVGDDAALDVNDPSEGDIREELFRTRGFGEGCS
jgi:hypothetical protein